MFHFENELEKTISEEMQIYASKEYSSHIISAMLSKEASSHTSVVVDTMDLFESNIAFAHYIFQNPRRALKLLDDAFQKVSLEISKAHELKADMVYKENLHVRLIALPNLPEVYRSNLPNCSDVGQFLCISGTVVKASTAKILQYKKLWRCSKCKFEFIVEAEVEQGYICEKPIICKNPDFCNGKNFTLMSTDTNVEYCKDYQEIKLQEQVYNLSIGTVPRSMWVVLEDDLVETCYPGNDVIVSGILIQQWKPLIKGNKIDIDLVILAHNIEVQNKMTSGTVSKEMIQEFKEFWHCHKANPLSGRNFILSSICPQVFGLYVVKLAVALVLAGGVQKKSGSSRIRGDSHLLLVGDPGTAKSQFLKFATKVSPRSVLTSGIGTTNAGLTVSAIKESGRWELEAGALVLADGGICCIDEFSCIKEQDKTCIHEAMEQQTISVAKAGLVCSLNTRCSILAATNPKSKYDESMSLSENTALGSPLLSRFDIILVLLDTYDENWDNMVASYILGGRNVKSNKSSSLWSISKMKSYIILIRNINPRMTPQAEKILRSYYTKQRSFQSRNTSRTTPRLLQSLIRLAEGHARLMLRTEVLIMDAVIAIILVDSSMLDGSILEGLSPLHTIFPDNPIAEYIEKAEKVFQNLNVEIDIKENYEYFYEESHLKNLFQNISAVWTSKDVSYLFQNSTYNDSSNSNPFQHDISSNEITNNKYYCDESGSLNHKPAQTSNVSQTSPSLQQFMSTETLENIPPSNVQPKELNNQVSTLSDLRNIFGGDISETKCTGSKNIDNSLILNQILDSQNEDECADIELLQTRKDGSSQISYFGKSARDTEINYDDRPDKNLNNSNSHNFERSDIDILEELGITQDKRSENLQVNMPATSKELNRTEEKKSESILIDSQSLSTECSKSQVGQSVNINKIFPSKRSLAEQLKNFAFSKSHSSYRRNLECSKMVMKPHEDNNKAGLGTLLNIDNNCKNMKSNNYNKAGPSTLLNTDNNGENLKNDYHNKAGPSTFLNTDNKSENMKSNIYNKYSKTSNQFVNKKSAFKMIVDRYKSSQSNITEKKDESYSRTLETSQSSQNIDELNNIQNNKNVNKIAENKIELRNTTENQIPQITENHSSKNLDKLQKFRFSKKKNPQT